MAIRWISAIALAAALALPTLATAQEDDEELRAAPVVVTATRTEQEQSDVAGSITVIEQDEVQLGRQTLGLRESLTGVPGVYVQNQENFAGDLRLSIRGFGSRGSFGIRGIKILVDGIPETTPDGQTNVDSIEVSNVERIEVLRGPNSALYGASAGGVLSLTTEGPPLGTLVEGRVTAGSYGFLKEQIKVGAGDENGDGYILNATNFEYDGFRDYSRVESHNVYAKIVNRLSEDSDVTAILSYFNSPKSEDPNGLTREQLEDDREQARPDTEFAGGSETLRLGEEVRESKSAILWNTDIGDDRLSVSGYNSQRIFSARIPPTVIEFERNVVGGAAQYLLATPGNRLLIGTDVQEQVDRRRNYPNEDGRPTYPNTLNQVERAQSLGVFAQDTFSVSDALQLNASVRQDSVEVTVSDQLKDTAAENDSGSRDFDETSYGVGANYELFRGFNLFANYSQAYEIPSLIELRATGGEGGLNPDLDPQRANSIELGARSLGSDLTYEAVVFYITAEDEIITFQEDEQDFARNAAETERTGAELSLGYAVDPTLRGDFSLSYMNAEYVDYDTVSDGEDVDYRGNRIPGIPETQAHVSVSWRHGSGFYVIPDATYVSDIEVDDANSDQSDAYTLVNVRGGYLTTLGDNVPFSVFAGVNNVTDEEYNQNVRINDGFGRFFEPGPPTTVYVGVSAGLVGE